MLLSTFSRTIEKLTFEFPTFKLFLFLRYIK